MFGNNFSNPFGNYNPAPYGYNPNAYTPNYMQQNQTAVNTPQVIPATNTNKIFVNGIEDVRSKALPPNSDYTFLDNDKPILYQKVVDSKGQFDVKVYDIIPHKEEQPIKEKDYVSREEFNKLYAELDALKQQLGGIKNESVEQHNNTSNAQQ